MYFDLSNYALCFLLQSSALVSTLYISFYCESFDAISNVVYETKHDVSRWGGGDLEEVCIVEYVENWQQ